MKFQSLQALRGLAFLGIFFLHADFFINWAYLGVAIFFVLSGFLMIYNYGDKKIDSKIKFSIQKIKKIYLLHIITMLFAIILSIIILRKTEGDLRDYISVIIECFLNVCLLQTWIPKERINVSLNGVAWYLSVTLFLYFMFTYINSYLANKKIKELFRTCVAVIIFQVVTCILMIYVFGKDSSIYHWYMYCFPIFRLGDFFIGCCLGKVYQQNILSINKNNDFLKYSIIEILVTIFTILVYIYVKNDYNNIILVALKNNTTLYMILAVAWVCLFVLNKGILTKVLNNKVLIGLGNLSAYMFLIHYVITRYTHVILRFCNVQCSNFQNFIIIILELLGTILISLVYSKFEKKYKLKIEKRDNSYKKLCE